MWTLEPGVTRLVIGAGCACASLFYGLRFVSFCIVPGRLIKHAGECKLHLLRKQHFKIWRVSKIHDMMAKCGCGWTARRLLDTSVVNLAVRSEMIPAEVEGKAVSLRQM